MALKIRTDDDGSCIWVELQGTDAELNAAKAWCHERWGPDRALPYKHNRTLRYNERRRYNDPTQILATTIPIFSKADAMLFKLTWANV
jgi:hypothetical protein